MKRMKKIEGYIFAVCVLCFCLFFGTLSVYANDENEGEKRDGDLVNETSEQPANLYVPGSADGWYASDDGWYFIHSHYSVTGWLKRGREWYYLDPAPGQGHHIGHMVTGAKEIGDQIFYFGESGAMRTGWVWHDGGWQYYTGWGNRQTGWLKDGGIWYYLNPDKEKDYPIGHMVTGAKEIGGQIFYFGESGAMRTGWVWHDGGWQYYSGWGNRQTGWLWVGGKWYYLDPAAKGQMAGEGWHQIDGKWYLMGSGGDMLTGWHSSGGNWYLLGGDGALRTGWQQTGGGWYYLYGQDDPNGGPLGAMASSTTIDGYKIPKNGNWSGVYYKAGRVLDSRGWDLYSAFTYASTMIRYKALYLPPSMGTEYYAEYGFDNGRGDCYVMASIFCILARELGYDARQIAGYVFTLNGKEDHSWVEIDMDGSTYVFDPSFQNGSGRNGYKIWYGKQGTWRYTDYAPMSN